MSYLFTLFRPSDTKNRVMVAAENPEQAVNNLLAVTESEFADVVNFKFVGDNEILFELDNGYRVVVKPQHIWSAELSGDNRIWKENGWYSERKSGYNV